MKKDDYMDLLKNNEFYQTILQKASDDKERRFIKAYTEEFMLNFYSNVFKPFADAKEKDPDIFNKLAEEFKGDLIRSGSSG